MEKFAKDFEGFVGPCSLPRLSFFASLWKDKRSPQLRVFPAWGSPQMARLASKLTSHSTGRGGAGLSPADGEESCSENNSQKQGEPFFHQRCSGCGGNAPGVGMSQAVSFLPPSASSAQPHRSDIVCPPTTLPMNDHQKGPPV